MKFSHGAWQWTEGVVPTFGPAASSIIALRATALWIAGLDRQGKEGVDRFEGLVLELRVTSPMPDVIRVQVRHHHHRASAAKLNSIWTTRWPPTR